MATNKHALLAGPTRPLGSPEIPQFHWPDGPADGTYSPRLYGAARIHFGDGRRKIDETRRVAFLLTVDPGARTVDWDQAVPVDVMPEQLVKDALVQAAYLPLPSGAMKLETFTRWAKNFDRWLARTQRIVVASKTDAGVDLTIGPKRGGVSVELVGIVWQLA